MLAHALQKISNWYNNNCSKETKKDHASTMSKLLFRLSRESAKPHKLSLLQYYQREHYQARISARYDERFRALSEEYAAAKAAADAGSQDCTVAPPHPVAVRTGVAKMCLEEEDSEFLEQLKAEWSAAMEEEAQEYQSLVRSPASAEEYQQYVYIVSV